MKDIDACLELLAGPSTTCTIIEKSNTFFEKTITNSGHQVAKIAAAYGEEFPTCYPHMGEQPFKVISASSSLNSLHVLIILYLEGHCD